METIGNLIDKLITTNTGIWMQEDIKRDKSATDKQIADATRATNILNQKRNDLIQEIDTLFSEVAKGNAPKHYNQGSTKRYGK